MLLYLEPNHSFAPIVILQGSSSNMDFRGFMIQGRVRADDLPVGTFGNGTNHRYACDGNVSFVCLIRNMLLWLHYVDCCHSHQQSWKTSVNLLWTAPPAGAGCICFRWVSSMYHTYCIAGYLCGLKLSRMSLMYRELVIFSLLYYLRH